MTKFESINIKFFDSAESFGMSGPYIGKLKLNERELRHSYLDDNYVFNESKTLLAINSYQPDIYKRSFLFGLLKSDFETRKFRILVYNLSENKWYQSVEFWESLFLTRLTGNSIYYTQAFHDSDRKLFPEKVIEIDSDNFIEINENDLFKRNQK